VTRISSFDSAQDGEPVEPCLASKMRSALFPSRACLAPSAERLHTSRGTGTRTYRAPTHRSAMINPEQSTHRLVKSGESFTTSRRLNIIREFCKDGSVAAVVFDMVCTSRQAGWYEVRSCFPVIVKITWDGPPSWHSGIGTLARDHSLPQWTPMVSCADHSGLCVAGVV